MPYSKAKNHFDQSKIFLIRDKEIKNPEINFCIRKKVHAKYLEFLRQLDRYSETNTDAAHAMGLIYEKGIILDKNETKANMFFERSKKFDSLRTSAAQEENLHDEPEIIAPESAIQLNNDDSTNSLEAIAQEENLNHEPSITISKTSKTTANKKKNLSLLPKPIRILDGEEGYVEKELKPLPIPEDNTEDARFLTEKEIESDYNEAEKFYKNKDFKKATTYYLRAANAGHTHSMYKLAIIFDKQKMYKESFEWCKKAADKDHIPAQFALGKKFKEGSGTQPSAFQTRKYFTLAAEKGHKAAQKALSNLK